MSLPSNGLEVVKDLVYGPNDSQLQRKHMGPSRVEWGNRIYVLSSVESKLRL
jgi:hypothetical protein